MGKGGESLQQSSEGDNEDQDQGEHDDQPEGPGPRTLYFNLPLPPEKLNDKGELVDTYPRNKIRTAKYTPLSFIPKNLWLQFHNIANIYFLFLVILAVSTTPLGPCHYFPNLGVASFVEHSLNVNPCAL